MRRALATTLAFTLVLPMLASVALAASPPGAPPTVSAAPGPALGEVSVAWTAPADDGGSPVTAYRVYRGTARAEERPLLVAELGASERSWRDQDRPVARVYYYSVSAVNDAGEGPRSGEATAPGTAIPRDFASPPVANGGFEIVLGGSAVGWEGNATFEDCGCDGVADREAHLAGDLVQALPATQAFTLDFSAVRLEVEGGVVAADGSVAIAFSLTPLYWQHVHAGRADGVLRFPAATLVADADGVVRLDPVVDGTIECAPRWLPCRDFAADYAAATTHGAKSDLLDQARALSIGFYGLDGAIVDAVGVEGARTAAHAASDGHFTVNP